MKKELETMDSVRTVTSNTFITAKGLSELSLKARKALYIAISQCRKNDNDFYIYDITIKQFAELMGVAESNVYATAKETTAELLTGVIEVEEADGYRQYSLFSSAYYSRKNGSITLKLNPDMTQFLLHLKKDFTQPLLKDFLHMRSPYSMAVWHLMQREMHSRIPGITEQLKFNLTLSELRQVTGCESKFKQLVQFKTKVLDKALREIRDNCGIVITYENVKKGRTVVGFDFTAIQENYIDSAEIPESVRRHAEEGKRRIAAEQQKRGISPTLTPEPEELPLPEPQPHSRPLTQMEKEAYAKQTNDAEQLDIFSFLDRQ